MEFRYVFRQTNAYAMQLGGLFGIYWCVGLACFVAGFTVPWLHTAYLLLVVSVPLVGIALASYFEKQVRSDEPVGFSKAYLFSFFMYFYATVILAGVAYIYFRMFDGGRFVEANIAYLQRPEMKAVMEMPEMKEQMQQMLGATGFSSMEELLRSFNPIMIAASIIDVNLLLNIILSIPTAWLTQTRINKLIKK